MANQSVSMSVAGAMAAAVASLTPLGLPEKIVTMSRQIVNSSGRCLSIASAALAMHIGCSAAATPRGDFQRQNGAVFAGNTTSHSLVRASSLHGEATGSRLESQQFVRQLQLGWNASVSRRARSAVQSASSAAPDEMPGLTWTLFQTSSRGQTESQPIGLVAALGPSNPGYQGVRDDRSRVDTTAPLVPGWTRPLGLRLAIRW